MITDKEFTTSKSLKVRVKKTPALEMMAICDAAVSLFNKDGKFDFSTSSAIEAVQTFYQTAAEHLEVEVAGQWLPLKEKGRDVWWPQGIEEDFSHVKEIIYWFISDVALQTFMSSSE